MIQRRGGSPPPGLKLAEVIEDLFHMGAPWHDRKGGKKSQMWKDLTALGETYNGDLLDDARYHWVPIAESDDQSLTNEVMAEVINNACFGRADLAPAESTWTHVLPNWQMTLLRHIVGVGAAAFPGVAEADELLTGQPRDDDA